MAAESNVVAIDGTVLKVFKTKKGKTLAEVGYAFGQGPASVGISEERYNELAPRIEAGEQVAVRLGLRIVTKNEVVKLDGREPFAGSSLGVEIVKTQFGKAA